MNRVEGEVFERAAVPLGGDGLVPITMPATVAGTDPQRGSVRVLHVRAWGPLPAHVRGRGSAYRLGHGSDHDRQLFRRPDPDRHRRARPGEGAGVKVNLIFESPTHFPDGGGGHFYSGHPIYQWPTDQRPTPKALLHAKAVIVDGRDILVTSANLSNLAHQSSLEVGLLCRGGGIADRVQRHFDELISSGLLQLAT